MWAVRRTGDRAVLDPSLDEIGVEQLQCYLKCAEEVEEHWKAGASRTVWCVSPPLPPCRHACISHRNAKQ